MQWKLRRRYASSVGESLFSVAGMTFHSAPISVLRDSLRCDQQHVRMGDVCSQLLSNPRSVIGSIVPPDADLQSKGFVGYSSALCTENFLPPARLISS